MQTLYAEEWWLLSINIQLTFFYLKTHVSPLYPLLGWRNSYYFSRRKMFPRMHPAGVVYSNYLQGQNWVAWPNLPTQESGKYILIYYPLLWKGISDKGYRHNCFAASNQCPLLVLLFQLGFWKEQINSQVYSAMFNLAHGSKYTSWDISTLPFIVRVWGY